MKSQFFQSSRFFFILQTGGSFLLTRISNGRRFLSAVAKPAVFRFPTSNSAASFLIRKLDANTDLSSTE